MGKRLGNVILGIGLFVVVVWLLRQTPFRLLTAFFDLIWGLFLLAVTTPVVLIIASIPILAYVIFDIYYRGW